MQILVDPMLILIQAQLISKTIGSRFNWQDRRMIFFVFHSDNLRLNEIDHISKPQQREVQCRDDWRAISLSYPHSSSVQFSSVAQSCPTLCNPMDCSTPGLPVHHQLPESTQTPVHWVGDAIHHLILCRPLLLLPSIFPSIRVFSNESAFRIRWPKYWSFSFNISPSNEYSGLISFRMDWLDLLAVQGILKSLPQHHSSKASILQRSAFFIVQLSHPALIRRTSVSKVMSLLLNMLSRLVITFLPRSKHLFISWLQSPSAVILEPKKINKNFYLPWSDGTRCHDLSFLNVEL